MDDTEIRKILEEIMELAALVGWNCVIVQTPSGAVLGMNLGPESYLNYKQGRDPLKPTH